MKLAAALVGTLIALTGCEQQNNTKVSGIAPGDFKLQGGGGGTRGGGGNNAELESRIAKIESYFAKPAEAGGGNVEARLAKMEQYSEALDFLQQVYESQPKKPARDLCAAVDISENLRIGQVEGAVGAPITIIEAFDFA